MNKIIKFKIWGDYAHFKKFYTTTSPLTFEFPPPPTIIGMISAIIGLDKNEYLERFQNADDFNIALSILNPIKKVRWTQNLIDTKHHFWRIKNRTQIRIEFVKDSAYCIYFFHKDKAILDLLEENLTKHKTVYSFSLGLSELLANFELIDVLEAENIETDDWVNINSVLPYSYLKDDNAIDFEINREIFKINYPILMESDRVVNKREDILFERNGRPIKCKLKKFWKTEKGDNIVFF